MNDITIVGAGLAGLLAGRMLSGRGRGINIIERQAALPNNHSAVLRFRSNIVAETTGIPFKEVMMVKAVLPWRNEIADMLSYSRKNIGVALSDRSIIATCSGCSVEPRWIAPPDLIKRMGLGLEISFNNEFDPPSLYRRPVISTIPMPALMRLLEFPHIPEFEFISGVNIRCKLQDCDAYVSLLVPDPNYCFSRVSITGDELIVEIPGAPELLVKEQAANIAEEAAMLLGFEPEDFIDEPVILKQSYAKIRPTNEHFRRDFIYWATDKHQVYSLGRFATWRPKLLLDDLVQDVRKIEHWIERADRYSIAKVR